MRTPLPNREPFWVSVLVTSSAEKVPAGTRTWRTPTIRVVPVTPNTEKSLALPERQVSPACG